MVGTIEPRKGYDQIITAFEQLWHRGSDVNLVIVGRVGWRVKELEKKLRTHKEAGSRLHWIKNASDLVLIALYESVDGLIMASKGEGFGLPLVEIAQHEKPILARDIPVFRELAAEHARYFYYSDSDNMANEISAWLDMIKEGRAISSRGVKRQSWNKSVQQLVDGLID